MDGFDCPITDATLNPWMNKTPASSDESDETIVDSEHLMMFEQSSFFICLIECYAKPQLLSGT